jgi:excisionase family DNA binding protein
LFALFAINSSPQKLTAMTDNAQILEKLTEIANKLDEQNLLQKTVLNFNEACKYLDVSPSHLYKLTSTKQVPHFCPQGKMLYFKRMELDNWLQRNRQATPDDPESDASDLVIRGRK